MVFWAIGHEQYLLSAVFGLLFAGLADPGGSYRHRASHIALFALIGAGITALGFGSGEDVWGWLVLAAFALTLVSGLAAAFGVRRFVTALLLNLWFIIRPAAAPRGALGRDLTGAPGENRIRGEQRERRVPHRFSVTRKLLESLVV
ncbi:hypothetical protein J2S46_001319 [Kitasatospora herbaricolor]|uniref:hypothetical protein n=1 Tax=Kitasatospora herbaricolor TaxID=68217 RepID=UPI001E4A4C0C|nr:hypothetical protein [Kitasatospora herbaricolor]MDQ0306763.1 hypothetical protein [Kitasatospora herbaricolor]